MTARRRGRYQNVAAGRSTPRPRSYFRSSWRNVDPWAALPVAWTAAAMTIIPPWLHFRIRLSSADHDSNWNG